MAYQSNYDQTRRRFMKLGATTIGLGFIGTSTVGAQPSSNRTVILGHKAAKAANGIATDEKAQSRRGSWLSEGDSDGNGGEDKFFLWIDPERPPTNLGSFTIADIDHISYWTNKPVPASEPDFYISIYTEPDDIGDDASWYGHRLNGEPIYAHNRDGPANQWNRWNARSGFSGSEVNELGFSDSNHAGVPIGFFDAPTLSDLQAGPLNWSDYTGDPSSPTIDYREEEVKSIVLATGTPWSDDFHGYLDTVEIGVETGPGRAGKGQTLTIDLEPGRNGRS